MQKDPRDLQIVSGIAYSILLIPIIAGLLLFAFMAYFYFTTPQGQRTEIYYYR